MILLTGSSGMIGSNIKRLWGKELLTPSHDELDLTNNCQVKDYIRATNPEYIIHCGSNDDDICLYDNLRMFKNLADLGIPMLTFCTGRELEDRSYKNGEYVFSKHLIRELARGYKNVGIIKIWGCFGLNEKPIRFLRSNMERVKQGLPIIVSENKLFSYIYVKDLVKIIRLILLYKDFKFGGFVAYTETLLKYGEILKEVTGSPYPIQVDKENFYHSYSGNNRHLDLCANFEYTPLEEAISDYWKEFN